MPIDLAELVTPATTAVVTQEVQAGVVGPDAALPELAAAAAPALPRIDALCRAARGVGIPVVHCVFERRDDGLGSNHNARLFAAMAKAPVALRPGSAAVDVVDQVAVEASDLYSRRRHGVGPMTGTDLDPVLRNLGVDTIVGVGVSLNIGMTNFVMDAVNRGYRFVLPRDAVAGVPAEYANSIIDHTLSLLATVTTVADVLASWGPDAPSVA